MRFFADSSSPARNGPSRRNGFEGWYYKQRAGDYMLAFIPGRAEDGAFVQMIDPSGTRHFSMPEPVICGDTVRIGDCLFSPQGLRVSLPGVEGVLRYEGLTPLRSDIMGPFARLPLQCRHGVVSMSHSVSGQITVDGTVHEFDRASGYCEKDAGRSFPRAYLWLQCNDFPCPVSVMAAVAHIPFLAFSFTGCLAVVVYAGTEYRFATYRGVRIEQCTPDHIRLRQGRLVLDLTLSPHDAGQVLRAPLRGSMSADIRECRDADLRLVLSDSSRIILDTCSSRASCEVRPWGSAPNPAQTLLGRRV